MSEVMLVPMDVPVLRRLAAGQSVDLGSTSVPEGAWPPFSVVSRALSQLEAGVPPEWCVPYLILHPQDVLLGGCGFKGAPADGCVEILYGTAPELRGRGTATAAVGQLLKLAVASGDVRSVVANILPRNAGSSKVVAHHGFTRERTFIDTEGREVVQWIWRADTP